ncbi:MAG: glycosyltransferase [Lachnospiraceae bacterium]|nr:glycosyltransferase [Lachnospiraceae bacterium]
METTQPLISIIMPIYNAELYIDAAINSVIQQTFKDWELILVDDASKDNSYNICKEWAEKDSRITVRHLSTNKGAGNARNVGMDLSKGRYITFMDADDTLDKGLYESVTSGINQETVLYSKQDPKKHKTKKEERIVTDTDMVVWGVTEEYYNHKGKHTGSNILSLEDAVYNTPEMVRRKVIRLEDRTLFGYQWNHLYKREIIKDNNIRFEKVTLYEDYFFNLKVIEHINTMIVSSNCGYHYYKRENQSLTNTYVPEYYKLSRRRVESMYETYKRWQMYTPEVKNSCGQRLVRYTLSALVRNCSPKSNMSHKDRRKWVKRLYKDNLYRAVAKHCYIEQIPLRILRGLINRHCTGLILTMGRFVYIVKEGKPDIFAKKRQIH